ncbi:hypothetical protein IQ265_22505 [Nodosilinea sp. LEGE 06152]|uniref:hypothetical protein n=1 Tax=Nodosilinea sp. LEGE 06152 TaxID=2777966 RepID=UPI00188194F9|nr:hypothetical protein [Nodosilinea sp. LEGE 06152]MBE9159582.1 hypothetical protein [Nodosilinea sp. LEGE 06152]
MDIDKAIVNPLSAFATPLEVCNNQELTLEQKVEILHRWEYDARELQVAAEENMAGGEDVSLEDVLAALHQLGASAGPSIPIKQ